MAVNLVAIAKDLGTMRLATDDSPSHLGTVLVTAAVGYLIEVATPVAPEAPAGWATAAAEAAPEAEVMEEVVEVVAVLAVVAVVAAKMRILVFLLHDRLQH